MEPTLLNTPNPFAPPADAVLPRLLHLDTIIELAASDVSDEERTIVGTITTNAVDRYGEIVEPDGAILDAYLKNPVVLLNHMSWMPAVGRCLWIKPQGKGLVAKTQFADTDAGRDVYELYKGGFMKAWSIGFLPVKWEDGNTDSGKMKWRRRFTQWELLEYSAVTVPANPEAVSKAMELCGSQCVRGLLSMQLTQTERGILAPDPDPIQTEPGSVVDLEQMIDERMKSFEAQLDRIESQLKTQHIASIADEDEEPELETKNENTVNTTRLEMSAAPRKYSEEQIARAVVEALGRNGVKFNNR